MYLLPIKTRMPLKFGPEVTTEVTCARISLTVETRDGKIATGWGETPLSVQWVWPSALSYAQRHDAIVEFSQSLVKAWAEFREIGHPMEVGSAFVTGPLTHLWKELNQYRVSMNLEPMPWLAALVCCSAFDLALHDAYGIVHEVNTYDTYTAQWMNRDLASYLMPAEHSRVSFEGRYPADFLIADPPKSLPAWHLVGGKDPVTSAELMGSEPNDGYPVLLEDWIRVDGLKCLKIKLRGDDPDWDYDRLVSVGNLAVTMGCDWLTTDFNCTVHDPEYVNTILDRLIIEYPRIYGMILYVEQPFPYELEAHPIDVRSVSARKPLFMDESAHDWHLVQFGRGLGWTGVALKTCKTQTGALLSLAWAKAHGMTLMVQDLSNPMLAQIPHCLLAAHAGTIMGVETNGMQFYPAVSGPEAAVHPGLYRRQNGQVDLSTLSGPGFGYRLAEIERELPPMTVGWE
jgi:L-alanine-DL-glutamate epimerase-like enolase superfamily enzyme